MGFLCFTKVCLSHRSRMGSNWTRHTTGYLIFAQISNFSVCQCRGSNHWPLECRASALSPLPRHGGTQCDWKLFQSCFNLKSIDRRVHKTILENATIWCRTEFAVHPTSVTHILLKATKMWANCSFVHCGSLQKIHIDIYVLMSLGPAIHKGRPH